MAEPPPLCKGCGRKNLGRNYGEAHCTVHEVRRGGRYRLRHRLRPHGGAHGAGRRELPHQRHDLLHGVGRLQLPGLHALRVHAQAGALAPARVRHLRGALRDRPGGERSAHVARLVGSGRELPHRENRRHGHRHGVQLRDAQDLPRRRHRRRPRVANGRPLRFENELRTARLGRWGTRCSVLE